MRQLLLSALCLSMVFLCSFGALTPRSSTSCSGCTVWISYEPENIGGSLKIEATYTPDNSGDQRGECKQVSPCGATEDPCDTSGTLTIKNVSPFGNPLRWSVNNGQSCHTVPSGESIEDQPIDISDLQCGSSIQYGFQFRGCDSGWNPQLWWEIHCNPCSSDS